MKEKMDSHDGKARTEWRRRYSGHKKAVDRAREACYCAVVNLNLLLSSALLLSCAAVGF